MKRNSVRGPIGLAVVLGLLTSLASPAEAQTTRARAPELDGGVGWIGTDKPLKLADLRGKIVILDFWTLC